MSLKLQSRELGVSRMSQRVTENLQSIKMHCQVGSMSKHHSIVIDKDGGIPFKGQMEVLLSQMTFPLFHHYVRPNQCVVPVRIGYLVMDYLVESFPVRVYLLFVLEYVSKCSFAYVFVFLGKKRYCILNQIVLGAKALGLACILNDIQ